MSIYHINRDTGAVALTIDAGKVEMVEVAGEKPRWFHTGCDRSSQGPATMPGFGYTTKKAAAEALCLIVQRSLSASDDDDGRAYAYGEGA